MTSKEVLDRIRKLNSIGLTAESGLFDEIEKDLEVLEILKEYFCYSDFGQWYIDMQESDFDFKNECSREEWENSPQKKIKEWLDDN